MPSTPSTADSWEPFRDAQKGAIAAVLIELVNEQDNAVTIAQIADRAGVSRPTFYKYFPTLGAAMLFAHRQVTEEIFRHGMAMQTTAENADGLTRFLDGMRTLASFAEARPDLVRFTNYFDYAFRRHGLTESESRSLLEAESQLAVITRTSFENGQRDGSIRRDLDVDQTVEVMGMSMLGLVQRVLVTGSPSGMAVAQQFATALDAWRRYLSP
ncbi:TetR/AcrR family transcriptional regulator [Actinoplanes missouriensis]|uniref:TetR/AcrR family transcriptional regulator n=1 Tax=Actinoplanes missouriensis TaxID=1866 RepID=UPI0034058409